MDEKTFKELEANLEEAVKVAKGQVRPRAVYLFLSPEDIKSIRERVKLSQAEFAREFQLHLDTLKGWEQGKRKPDAAARNFLRMIQADPDFVRQALSS